MFTYICAYDLIISILCIIRNKSAINTQAKLRLVLSLLRHVSVQTYAINIHSTFITFNIYIKGQNSIKYFHLTRSQFEYLTSSHYPYVLTGKSMSIIYMFRVGQSHIRSCEVIVYSVHVEILSLFHIQISTLCGIRIWIPHSNFP